ncbi:DUF5412 family protein [Bacillus spongiae]|uniref:DUF5412 family protein n=1 Tax=Bacillus spongiae TaxID=2683610 RepID=A0ABU8HK48_9BACI
MEMVNHNNRISFMKKAVLIGTFVGITVVTMISDGVYWLFYDLDQLPQGEFLTEKISPGGKYTLKAYVTNVGATTSHAVRGELILHEEDDVTKNIYWNDREDTATSNWTDADTVNINGYSIDVPNAQYDYRRE